jgi:hypothetical protein
MMTTDIETIDPRIVESLVLDGDLSKMPAAGRLAFYLHRCKMLQLDPAEEPFQLIKLNGKLKLYATKTCAAALTRVHKLSVEVRSRSIEGDLVIVEARASHQDGRFTDDIGALELSKEKSLGLANSLMKCTTKAKRRAVLALVGLGMLDESELDTVRGAQRVRMDVETGATMDAIETSSRPTLEREALCTGKAEGIAIAIDERLVELAGLIGHDELDLYRGALVRCEVMRKGDDAPARSELTITEGKRVSEFLKASIGKHRPVESQLATEGGPELKKLLEGAVSVEDAPL